MQIENVHQSLQDIQIYEKEDTPEQKDEKDQYEDFLDCVEILKMITTDYSTLILDSKQMIIPWSLQRIPSGYCVLISCLHTFYTILHFVIGCSC